ncbi:unnamed protein product, partial [Aphanomyces euteiches]
FIDFNNPATFTAGGTIGSGFGDGGDVLGPFQGLKGNGIGISLTGDNGTAVDKVTQGVVNAVKIGSN